MDKPRSTYDTVTLPVLIPGTPDSGEGTATFEDGLAGLKPVRRFRLFSTKTAAGRKVWDAFTPEQRQRFLAVNKASDALARSNAAVLIEAADQLASAFGEYSLRELATAMRSVRALENAVASHLSNALGRVRLVLWREPSRGFVPAIFCPDSMSALYVSVLMATAGGLGVSVCPHCGEPFVKTRSDQDYCSIKHREAHRVARWRAAQRQKGKPGRKKKIRQTRARESTNEKRGNRAQKRGKR